ncbi:hypothetical protein SKAU_G00056360 [Synaphobranchus kaupii]|uniref:Uncharacterized protein n=1 Tax=Synaphobranchus kaupii TaxID=118154 RepID=A0A9Q1G4H3_SYNKA|nr:hypothetical protein SKAU_G00056360 [Synaphobranchus kaupii]
MWSKSHAGAKDVRSLRRSPLHQAVCSLRGVRSLQLPLLNGANISESAYVKRDQRSHFNHHRLGVVSSILRERKQEPGTQRYHLRERVKKPILKPLTQVPTEAT